MFYIVRVYIDSQAHDYEYGMMEQAKAHMSCIGYYAKLYVWLNGREEFICAVN